MFIGWQPLTLAVCVYALTQVTKKITDNAMGRAQRKENTWVTRVVFPVIPPLWGALLAVLVPARPDSVIDFVVRNEIGWSQFLIFAVWGAACGQFADYLYTKLKRLLEDVRV